MLMLLCLRQRRALLVREIERFGAKKNKKKKKNGLMFYFIMKIITLNILRNNKTLQKVELINKIDLLFEDTRTFQYVL